MHVDNALGLGSLNSDCEQPMLEAALVQYIIAPQQQLHWKCFFLQFTTFGPPKCVSWVSKSILKLLFSSRSVRVLGADRIKTKVAMLAKRIEVL